MHVGKALTMVCTVSNRAIAPSKNPSLLSMHWKDDDCSSVLDDDTCGYRTKLGSTTVVDCAKASSTNSSNTNGITNDRCKPDDDDGTIITVVCYRWQIRVLWGMNERLFVRFVFCFVATARINLLCSLLYPRLGQKQLLIYIEGVGMDTSFTSKTTGVYKVYKHVWWAFSTYAPAVTTICNYTMVEWI